MTAGTPWYCDEHGLVLHADWTGTVEFSVLHFCPSCGREVFRRDPLSEIEKRLPADSFERWMDVQEGEAA